MKLGDFKQINSLIKKDPLKKQRHFYVIFDLREEIGTLSFFF